MQPFVFRFPVPDSQLYDVGNWHSPYFFLAFFKAREVLFESFGITQEKIKNEGLAIIAVSLHCDYFFPFVKGEMAVIEIAPIKLGRSSMAFFCKVYKDGDNERRLYASGKTTQILIDRKTKKPTELPDWIRESLTKLLTAVE